MSAISSHSLAIRTVSFRNEDCQDRMCYHKLRACLSCSLSIAAIEGVKPMLLSLDTPANLLVSNAL